MIFSFYQLDITYDGQDRFYKKEVEELPNPLFTIDTETQKNKLSYIYSNQKLLDLKIKNGDEGVLDFNYVKIEGIPVYGENISYWFVINREQITTFNTSNYHLKWDVFMSKDLLKAPSKPIKVDIERRLFNVWEKNEEGNKLKLINKKFPTIWGNKEFSVAVPQIEEAEPFVISTGGGGVSLVEDTIPFLDGETGYTVPEQYANIPIKFHNFRQKNTRIRATGDIAHMPYRNPYYCSNNYRYYNIPSLDIDSNTTNDMSIPLGVLMKILTKGTPQLVQEPLPNVPKNTSLVISESKADFPGVKQVLYSGLNLKKNTPIFASPPFTRNVQTDPISSYSANCSRGYFLQTLNFDNVRFNYGTDEINTEDWVVADMHGNSWNYPKQPLTNTETYAKYHLLYLLFSSFQDFINLENTNPFDNPSLQNIFLAPIVKRLSLNIPSGIEDGSLTDLAHWMGVEYIPNIYGGFEWPVDYRYNLLNLMRFTWKWVQNTTANGPTSEFASENPIGFTSPTEPELKFLQAWNPTTLISKKALELDLNEQLLENYETFKEKEVALKNDFYNTRFVDFAGDEMVVKNRLLYKDDFKIDYSSDVDGIIFSSYQGETNENNEILEPRYFQKIIHSLPISFGRDIGQINYELKKNYYDARIAQENSRLSSQISQTTATLNARIRYNTTNVEVNNTLLADTARINNETALKNRDLVLNDNSISRTIANAARAFDVSISRSREEQAALHAPSRGGVSLVSTQDYTKDIQTKQIQARNQATNENIANQQAANSERLASQNKLDRSNSRALVSRLRADANANKAVIQGEIKDLLNLPPTLTDTSSNARLFSQQRHLYSIVERKLLPEVEEKLFYYFNNFGYTNYKNFIIENDNWFKQFTFFDYFKGGDWTKYLHSIGEFNIDVIDEVNTIVAGGVRLYHRNYTLPNKLENKWDVSWNLPNWKLELVQELLENDDD